MRGRSSCGFVARVAVQLFFGRQAVEMKGLSEFS